MELEGSQLRVENEQKGIDLKRGLRSLGMVFGEDKENEQQSYAVKERVVLSFDELFELEDEELRVCEGARQADDDLTIRKKSVLRARKIKRRNRINCLTYDDDDEIEIKSIEQKPRDYESEINQATGHF